MRKIAPVPFILFALIIFSEDIFGQGVYKSVDEKGTISFSDNPKSQVLSTKKKAAQQDLSNALKKSDSPTSPVVTTKKEAAKQDTTEVSKENEKRNELSARRQLSDAEIKNILLKYPTWRGNNSRSPSGSPTRSTS